MNINWVKIEEIIRASGLFKIGFIAKCMEIAHNMGDSPCILYRTKDNLQSLSFKVPVFGADFSEMYLGDADDTEKGTLIYVDEDIVCELNEDSVLQIRENIYSRVDDIYDKLADLVCEADDLGELLYDLDIISGEDKWKDMSEFNMEFRYSSPMDIAEMIEGSCNFSTQDDYFRFKDRDCELESCDDPDYSDYVDRDVIERIIEDNIDKLPLELCDKFTEAKQQIEAWDKVKSCLDLILNTIKEDK